MRRDCTAGTLPTRRKPLSVLQQQLTLDEPKGVLYVPAGNPAPDFDAELRTGENLYTDSVIAIDAATGRILGYNQVVKRDSHDWDVDTAPTLATTRSGKRIVASANKDGLLSILAPG
jgi:alcohol dehydrogenase (cytochrome c)